MSDGGVGLRKEGAGGALNGDAHAMAVLSADDQGNIRYILELAGAHRCYICSRPVLPGEGWWRDDSAWCHAHRPVWSHE